MPVLTPCPVKGNNEILTTSKQPFHMTSCPPFCVPTQFPTPETIGRLGISFWCNEFWDRLGGQALLIIG